jgi:hypothetical protein
MNGVGYQIATTTIRSLYDNRRFYDSYPSCQRDYVWKASQQHLLIDTILRGLPIPPIIVVESRDELMGIRSWVVDGQQRLKTVLRYMDGEFCTAKRLPRESGVKPVDPGCFYSDLSAASQNMFDFYAFPFCKLHGVDDAQIGATYRRLQYSSPLTFAEKLYSYDGVTKDLASKITDHPVWGAVYDGGVQRKQIFQAGVYIVLMEQMGIFANMTSPRMQDILGRNHDGQKWNFTAKDVMENLGFIEHLFHGASLTNMYHIIPVYQSVMLLRESGYKLEDAQRGSLSKWFMEVRRIASEERVQFGNGGSFAGFTKVVRQREFWRHNFETITGLVGSSRRDERRYFNERERITAWIRQNGRCSECNGELRFVDAVAHHTQAHTDGGVTNDNNCQLLHTRCHEKLHANSGAREYELVPA